jgi:inner membrane protein
MDNLLWILWLVIGIGLILAEVFTLGFVLLWFGIGAIAAAVVGMAGGGFFFQFLVFAIISVALTVMSRTIFSNFFATGGGHTHKMGIESLPGKIGKVSTASSGALNEGAVKVFGSEWTAFPIDHDTHLIEGQKVEIVEVKGSAVYVRPVDNELPGWRQG